jgi:PAS domain S-box-containing protein
LNRPSKELPMSNDRPNGSTAPAGLPRWQETVQELRTAEEELRAQNEALLSAAHALEIERQRYLELFNFAPDSYLVTDTRGNIRQANRAAAALFRRPSQYLVDKPLRALIHPDDRRRFDQLLTRLLKGEPARGEKLLVQPRAGGAVPSGVHANATRDADGCITGVSWLLHDQSDLKEAQERAVRAQRLGAMGQTVAALAHESRNALQRSQACLRLLALEVQDRPKAAEYVERVEKALADLHRLFEDVRVATAPPKMEYRSCDLRALWQEAWDQLEPARQGRDCAVSEEVDVDVTCEGDPFRLVQLFRNLFENALAAAPDPARIAVRATADDRDGRLGLSVDVADNGPGLSAVQRANVFEPFFTTKPGGMGLGLALVRRIAEAHGGTVEAVDAAGGAVIRVMLPRGGRVNPSPSTANERRDIRVTRSRGEV